MSGHEQRSDSIRYVFPWYVFWGIPRGVVVGPPLEEQ